MLNRIYSFRESRLFSRHHKVAPRAVIIYHLYAPDRSYSISIPYKAGNPVDTATELLNDQFGEEFADLPDTAGWDEEDLLGADIIDLPDDYEQQRQQLHQLAVDEEELEAEAEGDNRWDWLNDADYPQSDINDQTIRRIGVDVGVINFAVAFHVRASQDANALQVLLSTKPRDSTVVYQTTADYFHRLHRAVDPRASLIRDQYSLPRRAGNLQQSIQKAAFLCCFDRRSNKGVKKNGNWVDSHQTALQAEVE
ncbi:hypothetical protein MP228_012569 [Amoeboaphelidium protococcarum]|nr:hypothetical protein MP228_012569 [Amoeboaphelidium protococcarum]